MLRAVLFDFDFTLADSLAGVIESVNHALRALGLPEAEPDGDPPHRRSLAAANLRAAARSRRPCHVEAFTRHFVERADQIMVDRTRIYPEVPGVLAELRARGLRTAVVSTKYRYRIEACLRRDGLLRPLRRDRRRRRTWQRHKPDPEALLAALAKLGRVARASALYVGDHPVDAEAAASRRSPLRRACSPAARAREEFAAFPVERFIGSLRELLACADGG